MRTCELSETTVIGGFRAARAGLAFAVALGSLATTAKASPWQDGDPTEFLFHLEGVSEDKAKVDIGYCVDLAKSVRSMRDNYKSNNVGILGNLIENAFANGDRVRMRRAVMRRCMYLQGYQRYAVTKAQWDSVVRGGDLVLDAKGAIDPGKIERMAAFAAGARPDGGRLLP